MATTATSTDTSTQPSAQHPHAGSGISRDTLIAERKRGKEQGQRQLLRDLGVESIDDLKARLGAGSSSKQSASASASFDLTELEEMIGRAVEQRVSPIAQDLAAQKQAREAAAKDAEAKAKAQREAAERKAAEDAAEAEAAKAYKAEVAKLREVAESVGAKVKDKPSFDKLVKRVQVELQALDEEEFEEKFGEGATAAQYDANIKEVLADIRKARPELFLEPEKKGGKDGSATAEATAAAGSTTTTAAQAVVPATTSKPAAGTTTAAATTTPGAKRVLDVRKLSLKQLALYNRNRDEFRRHFEQGLIDYEEKK